MLQMIGNKKMYSGSPPTANPQKQLTQDAQLDTQLDKAPERPPTQEEVEARSKERITANGELVNKMIDALVDRAIVSQNEIDTFVLPNRNVSIRDLRKGIEDLTQKINHTTLDDDEQTIAKMESSRAVFVTELLYSVTGLIKTAIPKKINTLVADLRSEKQSGSSLDPNKIDQLKTIQAITPQWEALVTNSVDIMKYFREKHDEEVSNTLLGMLNESLYLAVNKDTSDLAVTELRSGGGTLADEMSEVTSILQRLFRIDLEVLVQYAQSQPQFAANSTVQQDVGPMQQPGESLETTRVAAPPEKSQTGKVQMGQKALQPEVQQEVTTADVVQQKELGTDQTVGEVTTSSEQPPELQQEVPAKNSVQ